MSNFDKRNLYTFHAENGLYCPVLEDSRDHYRRAWKPYVHLVFASLDVLAAMGKFGRSPVGEVILRLIHG